MLTRLAESFGISAILFGAIRCLAEEPQTGPVATASSELWSLHAQGTEVIQYQPGFPSPFEGPNSLDPHDNVRQTSSLDLFFGARLWRDGELYINPEYYQGFGFGGTHGLAAFPNAEAYKVGKRWGDVFFPHLYFQQAFGFGGEQERLDGGSLQLAKAVDLSRFTITAGRLSVCDQFDDNAYAHDPRTQFLNWVLVDNGAFDYAADSLGYIEGVTLDFNQKKWALRYGLFDVPKSSNSLAKDGHLDKAWQQVLEVERRYTFLQHPGTARLLGWIESADMGGYRQALATASPTPDITQSRHYRHQAGLGVSIDQELASDFGVFFRASWRDGQSEVWQFTDVDRNMSAGLQLKGQHWRRPNDTIGIAGILSAITSAHRDFLAAGGLGPVVGDGQLPHYANEKVLELYYNLALNTHLFLTTDFQWAENPGYNPDRGPIPIISGRAHFEF